VELRSSTTGLLEAYRPPSRSGALRVGLLLTAALLAVVAVASDSVPLAALAFAAALTPTVGRHVESWRVLLSVLVVVIFAIPIKRYEFPVNLPFDLEPYRMVVLLLAGLWLAALLVDPRVALRRSVLDLPLVAFFLALMISDCVNISVVRELGVDVTVVKALSFFASFVLVYFIAYSVVRSRGDIEYLVRAIVVCAAILSIFALVEYRTGQNYFDRLSRVIPVLEFKGDPTEGITRSGRLRVYASAQHPIALAGALAMVLPLAIYVALTTRKAFWWLSVFLVGLGGLSTVSRTGPLMVVVGAVTLYVFRPADTRRLIPLALPAIIVTFVILPNALGAFRSAFFPQGGLVAEQQTIARGNQLQADGRFADISPSLRQWEARPLFGQGFATRVVEPVERANARILDDQWLGLLVEVGVIGVGLLLWLFTRSVSTLGRLARRDASSLGLLSGSIAASIVAAGVGMITYDMFSFVQVTFLLFLMLAIGASVVALGDHIEDGKRRFAAPLRVRAPRARPTDVRSPAG
jgi:hypothetical protein